MQITKTGDPAHRPKVIMIVYGPGGIGKSTFSTTAPKPLLLDFENGSKYFGLRGINVDVVKIEKWEDVMDPELIKTIRANTYGTIVIDPIGEAMDKLKQYLVATSGSKYVQTDGNLTMAGWGLLKKKMRDFIKFLRDSGNHVLLVAHVAEYKDEEKIVKRPMIETKIAGELVNMVDVVGYMIKTGTGDDEKRVIIVDPSSDKFVAKDRTGQLGRIIEPDFEKIIDACQGNKKFAWSKDVQVKKATKAADKPEAQEEQEKEKPVQQDPLAEEEPDQQEENENAKKCEKCGNAISDMEALYSQKFFEKDYCGSCMKKLNQPKKKK